MTSHANIHHFDKTNSTERDDDGDLRLGYYFEIVDDGVSQGLVGPYGTNDDCEDAARKEWGQQAA